MEMLIGGKHISGSDLENVVNPYNGEVVDKNNRAIQTEFSF